MMFNDTLMLGGSYYQQSVKGNSQGSRIFYASWEAPHNLTFRGETFHQGQEDGGTTLSTYYGKVKWQFQDDKYLNYRYDFGDDVSAGGGDRHAMHTLTLGWWPTSHIRAKLEMATHKFDDKSLEDYTQWEAFIGYVF